MKLAVYDGESKVKDITLSEIWDKPSEKVLHQVVVARLANDRQGNACTKTKSEVAGGGRKPWKQKGTGRARQGSIRSPLWRGGGVTFGPKTRDFSQKINKKQKAVAYLYLFNKMNEMKRLKVISAFGVETNKTKNFLTALAKQNGNVSEKVCIVVDAPDANLLLSSRNLPKVSVCGVGTMDILSLFYADKILVTETALKSLDEKFAAILSK